MLQQILTDMYIDPDVLEALNEEQKKILFFKMREEQVRRWKERDEKDGKEGIKKEKLRQRKGPCKSVSWRLGSDGDVHVCIIGESDELKSAKFILSELRDKTAANPNNIHREKAESVKSSLTKPNRPQQIISTEPGIQLLLKKAEELSDSPAVSEESKQDNGSDQSADDSRGQTDDSDSGSAEEDTGLYRSHMSTSENTVADRLREIQLHRAMKEQLSISSQTRPLDTPTPDKVFTSATAFRVGVASLSIGSPSLWDGSHGGRVQLPYGNHRKGAPVGSITFLERQERQRKETRTKNSMSH